MQLSYHDGPRTHARALVVQSWLTGVRSDISRPWRCDATIVRPPVPSRLWTIPAIRPSGGPRRRPTLRRHRCGPYRNRWRPKRHRLPGDRDGSPRPGFETPARVFPPGRAAHASPSARPHGRGRALRASTRRDRPAHPTPSTASGSSRRPTDRRAGDSRRWCGSRGRPGEAGEPSPGRQDPDRTGRPVHASTRSMASLPPAHAGSRRQLSPAPCRRGVRPEARGGPRPGPDPVRRLLAVGPPGATNR